MTKKRKRYWKTGENINNDDNNVTICQDPLDNTLCCKNCVKSLINIFKFHLFN